MTPPEGGASPVPPRRRGARTRRATRRGPELDGSGKTCHAAPPGERGREGGGGETPGDCSRRDRVSARQKKGGRDNGARHRAPLTRSGPHGRSHADAMPVAARRGEEAACHGRILTRLFFELKSFLLNSSVRNRTKATCNLSTGGATAGFRPSGHDNTQRQRKKTFACVN